MKKLYSLTLAVILMFTIVACGDSSTASYEQGYNDGFTAGYEQAKSEFKFQSKSAVSETKQSKSSSNTIQYILNKKSKKFHYPECSSVAQMSESNKIYSNESRDTIIEKGYKPCGNCNP